MLTGKKSIFFGRKSELILQNNYLRQNLVCISMSINKIVKVDDYLSYV